MKVDNRLKEVILKLKEVFDEQDIRFVIIGALVPAVLIDMKHDNIPRYGSRETIDVDCTIQINDWEDYNRIKEALMENGFEKKEGSPEQRLFYGETPVDILPYSESLLKDHILQWPGSDRPLNMRGFSELFDQGKLVEINEKTAVPFAPLELVIFLKIQTWLDRKDTKDLEDLFYILIHYEEIDVSERRIDVFNKNEVVYETSGAYLAGQDLKSSLSSELIGTMNPLLDKLQDPDNPLVHTSARLSHQKPEHIIELIKVFKKGLEDEA